MMKLVKEKHEGVTIGYQIIENGIVKYTVDQNDMNKTWNLYEGTDVLRGLLETYDTLKELKADILKEQK